MTLDATRVMRWIERLAVLAVVAVWLVVALSADRALLERDGAVEQPAADATLTATAPTPPRR